MHGNKALSQFAAFYISFMRGVPLIALMLLVYFGFPQLMSFFGIPTTSWPKYPLVIAGFALNVSGYLAENMRSAYLAVDKSQFEAALSIGMTGYQTFIKIIFPQAFFKRTAQRREYCYNAHQRYCARVFFGYHRHYGQSRIDQRSKLRCPSG